MTTETFYWFDYETWGISPQWDRPAQFAGLRTDSELKVIGQPTMLYCQLSPDYLPDPDACLVTGLTPSAVNDEGVPEPQFIQSVLSELGHPSTCSVGYNNIRFDDEFTRYTCFRNFHDPYQHEWQSKNSRWDLLDVVRLTRALRPGGIEWPTGTDGKATNKLEHLTKANGLSHEHAHDALSDVYATLAVAQLIKRAQPRLFDYALSLKNKRTVSELLNWQAKTPVVHVSGMVPRSRSHASIVVPLMRHPTNANGVIVLDMRTDPEQLLNLDSDALAARVFNKHLLAEDRIHLRTVHINRCPMIAPVNTLTEADADRIGLDRNVEMARAEKVRILSEDTFALIGQALSEPAYADTTQREQAIKRCPEASLYSGGFLSDDDRRKAQQVTALTPAQLIGFEESHGFFDDKRLQRMLFNYRARNAVSSLSAAEKEQWFEDCIERLSEEDNPHWRTFQSFDEAMARADWTDKNEHIRDELMQWRDGVEESLQPD